MKFFYFYSTPSYQFIMNDKPKYDPLKHHRRSIRLQGYDYSSAGMYFVTICVKDRECLFGEITDGQMHLSEAGQMVDRWWQKIPEKFPDIELGEYQIMPNHFHGIVINVGANPPVGVNPRVYPDNVEQTVGADPRVRPDNAEQTVGVNPRVYPDDVEQTVGADPRVCPDDVEQTVGADPRVCPDIDDPRVCPDISDTTDGTDAINVGEHMGSPLRANDEHSDRADTQVRPYNTNVEHMDGADSWVSPYETNVEHMDGADNTNHEHLGSPLYTVVQWFKTMSTNEYIRNVKQNDWPPFNGKLWQRNYYEHIIRNEESYQRITDYIYTNPANWESDKLYVQ